MASPLSKSLADAISGSTRAAKHCCGGTVPNSNPQIEVDNLGRLKFPLTPKVVRSLVEQCQMAPFGKGTKTLVDTKVRKTFELSPDQFRVGDQWNSMVTDISASVATELGLPSDALQAELYKLLVYKRGGFFAAHRDSEKVNGMVASLIVVLPNPFHGGALIVRHNSSQVTRFPFQEAASGTAVSYAAFYADCEHEVQVVDSGVRVCLCYNLILKPTRTSRTKPWKNGVDNSPLPRSVRDWFAAQPAKPLVFALEHQYSERSLSGSLLKGTDRAMLDLVTSAAEETDCHIHLAHVTRHLQQFADDGSFDDWDDYRRYGQARKRRKLEIGETYEDELYGTLWTSITGKKQTWSDLPLDVTSIISQTPIDDWKPTSEEYEGYTGNAGNTLDRWYHRTALVLWPKTQHYRVIAAAGYRKSIPLFKKLMATLARSSRTRKEGLRADCVQFAQAIITQLPSRAHDDEQALVQEFCDLLVILNDRSTFVALLSKGATCIRSQPLKSLILHGCSQFGIAAFAESLRALLTPPVNRYGRDTIPLRHLEWLEAVCELPQTDSVSRKVVDTLCRLAVDWFCTTDPRSHGYRHHNERGEQTTDEAGLPPLLRALLNSNCQEPLKKVVQFVQTNRDQFTLEHGQVPALQQVIPWSIRKSGQTPPLLNTWLAAVRRWLEAATVRKPEPPTDWSRPSPISCSCKYCTQLNVLLGDPTVEIGRIQANEETRDHLIDAIQRNRCDVTHTIDKLTRPFSLVLTKTQTSFDRALRRYLLDTKLLAALPQPD